MKPKRGKWKEGAKTKKNLLTEAEAKKLVEACINPIETLAIKGLLYTGMRVNEFIHMRKDWIQNEFIKVPESQECHCYACRKPRYKINKKTGELELVKPANTWKVKVPEAARSIPILPEVKDLFKEYFSRHKAIMETIGNQPTAWKIVKRVAKRAEINKRLFPHALRGTFASIMAGKGFTALDIQAALGWKSIKTADEYIRISPDRLLKRFKEKWEE